mmetsp:Transcript_8656/g.21434  ORF Transcript_8656/g.21434 Transcript_8656/m.21434 type:complete len:281 (-) Transcript_8656:2124-2966(-)
MCACTPSSCLPGLLSYTGGLTQSTSKHTHLSSCAACPLCGARPALHMHAACLTFSSPLPLQNKPCQRQPMNTAAWGCAPPHRAKRTGLGMVGCEDASCARLPAASPAGTWLPCPLPLLLPGACDHSSPASTSSCSASCCCCCAPCAWWCTGWPAPLLTGLPFPPARPYPLLGTALGMGLGSGPSSGVWPAPLNLEVLAMRDGRAAARPASCCGPQSMIRLGGSNARLLNAVPMRSMAAGLNSPGMTSRCAWKRASHSRVGRCGRRDAPYTSSAMPCGVRP